MSVPPIPANDLVALAERCEKATGPDRELDRCLFAVLHGVERERVTGPMDFTPTASLDAAMTLVPENRDFTITTCGFYTGEKPFTVAKIYTDGDALAKAATPALALTAAALRARGAA